MGILYNLYSQKGYWIFKSKIRKAKFKFFRNVFGIKRLFSEEHYKVKSTGLHIKQAIWSIFRAVGFVSLLFWLENFSTNLWENNLALVPIWLKELQILIPKPIYPEDKDAIIDLISVIASVTGVILALFYPILATIASTAYAKVHASIRNLLLYEKETQGYLRRLTYLTAYSITVLFFLSLHLYPGNLILSFLAFYSFIILFGILKIGLGVYNFFEPNTLAGIVSKNITDSIINVTTEGEYWNERNFQNHNYNIAFEQLENLALINQLCLNDDNLKESSFKSIFQTSLLILQFYLHKKPRIPINSLWFPNSFHHLSYFESDMTLRGISKSSYTFVQPKVKQNHYWFEDRIINNLSAGLKAVVESGHINVLGESISMTHSVFNSLSSILDLRTGEIILNQLLLNIKLLSKKKTKGEDVTNYENWKDEIGSVETFCYTIFYFQASILSKLTQFDSSKLSSEFKKINWDDQKTIYSTEIIPELFDQLNNFSHFVKNEKVVEKNQVTPDWYYCQLLTAEYLGLAKEKINSTVTYFETYLLVLIKHFDEEDNSLLASFAAQIGLEILHKLDYRIDLLKPTLSDLDNLEVCKGEFVWSKPNLEELKSQLLKYERICLEITSKNIVNVSKVKWTNQFPDVFAQSYSILLKYLNSCFKNNNSEEFRKSFEPFMKAAFEGFNNLNTIFKHYEKPQNISYQTLLDLMEISGYAYIYSDIYKNDEFWMAVEEAWNKEFVPSTENIKILISYYNYYRTNLLGTGINYGEHHQRERTLASVTDRLELKQRDIANILVKPFIRDSYYPSFYNAAELFIEIYLFTFLNAKSTTKLMKREFFKHLCRSVEHPNPAEYDY